MGVVDCRRCKYFVYIYDVPESLREKIMYARGRRALGYCRLQKIPVIRYKGYCSHWEPREEQVNTLDNYVEITIRAVGGKL